MRRVFAHALPRCGGMLHADNEAKQWQSYAQHLWAMASSPAGAAASPVALEQAQHALENVFGTHALLRGLSATGEGSGALLSLQLRRALPL